MSSSVKRSGWVLSTCCFCYSATRTTSSSWSSSSTVAPAASAAAFPGTTPNASLPCPVRICLGGILDQVQKWIKRTSDSIVTRWVTPPPGPGIIYPVQVPCEGNVVNVQNSFETNLFWLLFCCLNSMQAESRSGKLATASMWGKTKWACWMAAQRWNLVRGDHLKVCPTEWIIFLFLVCYAATQLATQLPQRHLQVVRSNKVARKRLTESNGTPAMDLGQMNVGWMLFGSRHSHTQIYKQTRNRTKHTSMRAD